MVVVSAVFALLSSAMPATAGRYELEVPAPPHLSGTAWSPGSELRLEYRVENALVRLNTIAPRCAGHISETEPAFRVRILRDSTPTFRIESGGDSVLAIVGPRGEVHCNDDHNGLNSLIAEPISAGVWEVYVGTYAAGASLDTVLVIE